MRWQPVHEGLEHEQRRVGLLFLSLALLAPLLALLPPAADAAPRLIGTYLALTFIIGLVGLRTWSRRARAAGPLAIAFVVAVALLRHAEGGGASGYGPLFLLPLFWASLVGNRRSVVMTLAALAGALVAPIVGIGGSTYPVTEWRRAAIWLAVAPVVALATAELQRRSRLSAAAVAELARTDPLTGVLNRRGLDEVARREVQRAKRTGTPLTVALLDLDHFKRFNDTQGHDAGDGLLRDAAATWGDALRDTDVLARWGGEEFVILLPDTDPWLAAEVVDRLRASTPHGQTCSVGLTAVRAGATDPFAEAVARADAALYRAKEEGRDRIVVADA